MAQAGNDNRPPEDQAKVEKIHQGQDMADKKATHDIAKVEAPRQEQYRADPQGNEDSIRGGFTQHGRERDVNERQAERQIAAVDSDRKLADESKPLPAAPGYATDAMASADNARAAAAGANLPAPPSATGPVPASPAPAPSNDNDPGPPR